MKWGTHAAYPIGFGEGDVILKSRKIQVVLCEPGKPSCIIIIDNTLDSLQNAVGGSIQAIYPFDDPVAIICNEEGKINGMELNRALRDEDGRVYDILSGPFLVAGLGQEDFDSLGHEYQEKYRKLFECPEVFLCVLDEILAIPIDGEV